MKPYDNPTTLNENCAHKVAEHRHGTNACYHLDGCRCDNCRDAASRYTNHRTRWLAGVVAHPMVDAEPARQHLLQWVGHGMSTRRVAELTGVPNGAIGKLIYGVPQLGRPPSKRIKRENAEKLLACPFSVSDGQTVDGKEAHKIVAELVARGWVKAEIGRRISGNPETKSLQIHRDVMAGTLRTLRRLLAEPVPERVHSRWGTPFKPKSDHRWRYIQPTTPGVPAENVRYLIPREPEPEPDPMIAQAKGALRCRGCGEPLATHPMTRCA